MQPLRLQNGFQTIFIQDTHYKHQQQQEDKTQQKRKQQQTKLPKNQVTRSKFERSACINTTDSEAYKWQKEPSCKQPENQKRVFNKANSELKVKNKLPSFLSSKLERVTVHMLSNPIKQWNRTWSLWDYKWAKCKDRIYWRTRIRDSPFTIQCADQVSDRTMRLHLGRRSLKKVHWPAQPADQQNQKQPTQETEVNIPVFCVQHPTHQPVMDLLTELKPLSDTCTLLC